MSPIQPVPCTSGPIEVQLDCETDSVSVCEIAAETSTVSVIPASIVSLTLAAANTNRRGLSIFNDSSSDLFIKLGAGAATTSYTYKAGTNGYFEVPFNYTGIVTGIWSSATGDAKVTEVEN